MGDPDGDDDGGGGGSFRFLAQNFLYNPFLSINSDGYAFISSLKGWGLWWFTGVGRLVLMQNFQVL